MRLGGSWNNLILELTSKPDSTGGESKKKSTLKFCLNIKNYDFRL
jgi:hypothetical protein